MFDLPKWPAFHVKGTPVDKETAMDFIVKTDSFIHRYMGGNDKRFQVWFKERSGFSRIDKYAKEMGLSPIEEVELEHEVREHLGAIDLGDIPSNNISSPVVHGPCGFINPDGMILHKHNIGKWPDCDDVYETLKRIVGEWGVKFKATLYDIESCEFKMGTDATEHALVTFVSNGTDIEVITNHKTYDDLCFVGIQDDKEMGDNLFNILYNPSAEQGVSVSDLEMHVFPRLNDAVDKVMEKTG